MTTTRFIKIEGKEYWIDASKIEEIEIDEISNNSATFNVYVRLTGQEAWHKMKNNKEKKECLDYVNYLLSQLPR